MDHPTRPLDNRDPELPPEHPTQRLNTEDEGSDGPHCAKCNGRLVKARLTGAQLQIGSSRAIPGPYTMNCVALVCVDCGYTEFYAQPVRDEPRRGWRRGNF